MGRTPQAIGVAKRAGQLLSPEGINDEIGGTQESFWGIANEVIVTGETLCRNSTNPRVLSRAFGNAGTGLLQIVCGVALTDAAAGEKVKVLRRGIHPGVIYSAAGAVGQIALISPTTPGLVDPIAPLTGTTPAHTSVGIQLETATGAPLKASTYVSTYF